MKRCLPAIVIVLACWAVTVAHGGAQHQSPLVPDDLFGLRSVGDTALSPDGRTVAFTLRRPRSSASVHKYPFLQGDDRADIWIANVDGGPPENVTNGESDGSGHWQPVWSPDGSRLALLSTKGGDNIRLWVWERTSKTLTKASELGVEVSAAPPFAWVDEHRLVAVLLPDGRQPARMSVETRTAIKASSEWSKKWAGREPTASVLDSGVAVDLALRPQTQLALIDLRSSSRTLKTAPSFLNPELSPHGQELAFLEQSAVFQPRHDSLLRHGPTNRHSTEARYRIGIARIGGDGTVFGLTGASLALPNSLRWSRDSTSLAFIGVPVDSDDTIFRVFRRLHNGSVLQVPLPEGEPQTLVWAADGRLLVSLDREMPNGDTQSRRRDWWMQTRGGAPQNVTLSLASSPSALIPDALGGALVGAAGGDLWRLDVRSGTWTNLTRDFDGRISNIEWPDATVKALPRDCGHVVAAVARGANTDRYRVDIASGAVTAFATPSPTARLTDYACDANVGVFLDDAAQGTSISAVVHDHSRTLLETNAALRDKSEGQLRRITYRSLNGDSLSAWCILPPQYQTGRRYPLVTWVYAGWVAGETPPTLARLNLDHFLNLQLLAARGYVVLLPSMPARRKDRAGDPYMELTDGVLPAIDKLIEEGVADPKRLAVMGHSFGGFTTYGLVTQTNRFKAAIALAGQADFVSIYGTFEARFRYESQPHEWLFSQSIAESGQLRMGNPPWKDAGRYLRNSPLFYVDRVETPLLIIQGDMDYVSMTQGEQFFTALYRQGKRARFVRYWGEGHLLSSPANIRHMWQEIYRWLDECLGETPHQSARAQQDIVHR